MGVTTTSLNIAPTFSLPVDAATETFGILAKKGAGKSNAAVVMAEEMWDAGVPWVAIDPKGDWWGLRSSGDGEAPGLSLPVFGGRHGDIPLEPTSGHMLADLVLADLLTCVLDVSEFTKGETTKFLIDFADRLYRQADADPIHLFLEEAHEYLPQRVMRDEARLVGAWQKIVKQGRFKGIGCTLVSQRSASLNKDVLTQVDTLIVLRTTSPQDRKAVEGWVDVHDSSKEMLDTLPSLENGEAWVWSPEFLKTFERIWFRRRRTFDSGATPKVGEKTRRTPKTLADVDLNAIRKQMSETIERAKATDPKELQRQIKALERELKKRPTETATETVTEIVEVPVLNGNVADELMAIVHPVSDLLGELSETIAGFMDAIAHAVNAPKPTPVKSATSARRKPVSVGRGSAPAPTPANVDEEVRLRAGARRIVEAVARHHPLTLTKHQVATLANLKVTGGTFGTYWGDVRRAGFIVEDGQDVRITEAGMDYAGVTELEPMSTDEVLAMWRSKLRAGERAMLDVLVDAYPESISRDELAERADLTVTGGTFSTYLGVLRRNGLVEIDRDTVTASDTLFLAGSGS